MVKEKQRNTRKDVMLLLILIPISMVLIILNVIYFDRNNNEMNNTNNLNAKINEYNIAYEEIINNNNKIQLDIDFLNNLDTKIIETKKMYYTILKEFEDMVINNKVNYKIAYLTFDDGPII